MEEVGGHNSSYSPVHSGTSGIECGLDRNLSCGRQSAGGIHSSKGEMFTLGLTKNWKERKKR